jgi:type I restriction enzyme S subunit
MMKPEMVEASDSLPSLDEFEVPEGWLLTSVGELFQIVGGGTPSTKNPEYWEGDIPWISSADIYGLKKIVPRRNINQTAIKNSAAHLVPKGSIIVVTRVSLGRIAISDSPISYSQDCHALIPKTDSVYPLFALYYLFQAVQSFKNQSRGTTISGVTVKVVSSIPFPLPPLAEQQSIVARIEALLEHINTASYRLSRMPLIMKKFRQAVLAAACSGRLTEGWREGNSQITSASEALDAFFRSISDESSLKIFQKRAKDPEEVLDFEWSFEIPESWCWAKLENLAALEKYSITDGPFGSNLKTEHYSRSGPRVIRLQNIGDGSFIDIKSHISQSHFDTLYKHEIFSGDIVIGLLGDPIPRSCIIPEGIGPAIVKADCIRFKPNSDLALTEFLNLSINEPELRSQATESVHGVARPRLNLTQIKNFTIPLPPLAEQHEIIRRVNALFERGDKIEQQVVAATKRTEALTQAVLGNAFRGELVGKMESPP